MHMMDHYSLLFRTNLSLLNVLESFQFSRVNITKSYDLLLCLSTIIEYNRKNWSDIPEKESINGTTV